MSDAPRLTQTARGPASSPGELPPGFAVGEYRIEGVAGRGGMGVVYSAVQPVIEKKVAIKVLNAQLSADVDLVRRFVDEARAVNRIGHENIIDIFSFGQLPDGRQYFVMEYLEGATLAARLERNDLSATDIPMLLAQICDALEAAHAKKIVHRDLKPENVWIGASNRGLRVRLLDFGIAKLLDTGDQVVTDIGAVMGTPHFMSPEQCHGRGVDHRTDIYAMGVMMYRIFTGRLPFVGETFAEILAKQITETPPPPGTIATMPAALNDLIVRCLSKEPTERPQRASDLAATLATIFPASLSPGFHSGPMVAAPDAGTGPTFAVQATELPSGTRSSRQSESDPSRARASASQVTIAPARRSQMPWVLAAAAIVAAGIVVGWLALRGATSVDNRDEDKSAVPVPPSVARPAPPTVVNPGVAPPAAETTAVQPPSTTGPITKRRGDVDPKTTTPKPAVTKPPASRATRTGLVTDNPFE
jgi:serine/threonine protein kinase